MNLKVLFSPLCLPDYSEVQIAPELMCGSCRGVKMISCAVKRDKHVGLVCFIKTAKCSRDTITVGT